MQIPWLNQVEKTINTGVRGREMLPSANTLDEALKISITVNIEYAG